MDHKQLPNYLLQHFNQDDLQELCSRLSVEYDDLPGAARHEKVMALIAHMQKYGRTAELAAEIRKLRPHVLLDEDATDRLSWIDAVASGMGQANQAQITSQTNQLRDIHDPARSGPVTNAPILRRDPPPEMPTTNWEVDAALKEATPQQPGINPYHAGRVVEDQAMFFGRAAEQRLLCARLREMGSSAIVGSRRIGKSSLLVSLRYQELTATTLFAYLDLRNGRYHTLTGLLNGAISQWGAALEQTDVPQVDSVRAFSTLVQAWAEQGHQLALGLDGFAQLTKRPDQFGATLFADWQTLGQNKQLAFVTTSRQPLADLLRLGGLSTEFATLFTQINLGLLDETSALALVREPAQRLGIALPADAVDELLLLGGAHPFYLQMAAYHLINLMQMRSYQVTQLRQDFLHEAEPYWRRLWDELPALQQKLLKETIQPNPPLVIKRQYRLLVQQGILREVAGVYRPFSDAFGAWLDAEIHDAVKPARKIAAADHSWLNKVRELLKK